MMILPVTSVPESRMKDAGKSINALISGVDGDKVILNILTKNDFDSKLMYFATANGLVKATQMEEFDVKKSKIMACGLKEGDTLIYAKPNVPDVENMIFITSDGMSINIRKNEISVMGRSGKGVGAIKLGRHAKVVYAEQIKSGQEGDILLMTEKGYAKRTPVSEFEEQGRNGKGLKSYQLSEISGREVIGALLIDKISTVTGVQKSGDLSKISTDSIPAGARNTRGEQVILAVMGNNVSALYKNIFD